MTTALRLNARLDEPLARKLRELEQRTGASATLIVREALTRYFDEESASRSPLAVLEAAGVVGCVAGSPSASSRYKAELGRSLRKKHRRR